MSDTSAGTQRFEDHRWSTYRQEPVWRHRAACRLIRKDPIVDVGGGDALLLSMLREAGWNDLALADLSPVAVSIAKEAGFSAHVVDASQRLPFDDKSVGTACALDVLEHLYDPRAVVLEMARVADEVVIVVPNFHYWRERVQMLLGRIPFQSRPQRGHVHWFNPLTLMALLDDTGLEPLEILYESPIRLGQLGRWLSTKWPAMFAASIGVRAAPIRRER
jgi:SAM-dependent methyltransferase